ncbi:MAG: hypothetical protein EHM20_03610 [Alphaproteobacteria bacterium]|nr:MAG: hypothetical protein EHM20_03610 [Alphaproteobacteria bacterium]
MKLLTLFLTLHLAFASTNLFASEIDYSKIAGHYEITYELLPIHNEIMINSDSSIVLKEYGAGWLMTCQSSGSKILKGKLTADLKCDRTVERLSIMIDFNGVKDFNEFKARYYNTIYDLSDFMDFKRL